MNDQDHELRSLSKPPRCTKHLVASAEQDFTEALDKAARLTELAEKPLQKGLWVGLFPICRQTVELAKIVPGWLGERVVSIRFEKPYDEEFKRYSAGFMAKGQAYYPVAIRLNGVMLSRSTILEPMLNLELDGPSDDSLPSIVVAAMSACTID